MKKTLIISTLVLVLLSLGVGAFILYYPYSKGVRAGRLVKISKKGLILKTYEGTLDLGSGDQLTWQFSTRNVQLGESLEKLSGEMVRLEYTELIHKLFYDTKYNVKSFEVVGAKNTHKSLCRLVKVIRQFPQIVEQLRPMIEQNDPQLLQMIRKCQEIRM